MLSQELDKTIEAICKEIQKNLNPDLINSLGILLSSLDENYILFRSEEAKKNK